MIWARRRSSACKTAQAMTLEVRGRRQIAKAGAGKTSLSLKGVHSLITLCCLKISEVSLGIMVNTLQLVLRPCSMMANEFLIRNCLIRRRSIANVGSNVQPHLNAYQTVETQPWSHDLCNLHAPSNAHRLRDLFRVVHSALRGYHGYLLPCQVMCLESNAVNQIEA